MSDAALEAIMQMSWIGCLHWAVGDKAVIARYETETGKKFPRARAPIERLVDEAAGFNPLSDFVEWVTRELFGFEDAPKAYRDAVNARRLDAGLDADRVSKKSKRKRARK